MSIKKKERPFDLRDYDSNMMVMTDDGVPYVVEAMKKAET